MFRVAIFRLATPAFVETGTEMGQRPFKKIELSTLCQTFCSEMISLRHTARRADSRSSLRLVQMSG